jgi:Rps23 Pro-64 3,4-dihydroxylase Tpa1-like proline 4-hydroxylase
METILFRNPVPHLVIYDFFTKSQNELILLEALKHEKKFNTSTISKGIDKEYRNNKVAYYDELYDKKRDDSALLSCLDLKFKDDDEFKDILASSPFTLCDFSVCNFHETQVSRYGNDEKYKWHVDRIDNMRRHITLVYYFFKEPKRFKGGKLGLTNSPAYDAKLIDDEPRIKTIEPINNMAVVFSSTALHNVTPTLSFKDFESGRFSANIWIGYK